jgi:hypothetical protein
MRGEVDLAHDGLFTPRAQLQDGTLRALALTSVERSPLHPDIPTFGETLPGYEVGFWGGLLAPRGTPDAIMDRLAAEVDAVLRQPDVVTRIRGFGAEPTGGRRHRRRGAGRRRDHLDGGGPLFPGIRSACASSHILWLTQPQAHDATCA